MHLDRGGVERDGFDLDPHDLLHLQLFEDAVQHAVLGPAVHARIDRVPIAEVLRQPAPLRAVLGHIQHSIQEL